MRTLASTLLALLAIVAVAASAHAQYSPTIADSRELGVDVRVGDEFTSFAGIYQMPVGARTDVRFGLGIADPDGGDSELFLTGGLRGLLSRGSGRFPLDVALDGELNILFIDDTLLQIVAGPSFGGRTGRAGALIPYVQPVIGFTSGGEGEDDSDVDLAVRLGADYELTETVDVRGFLLIGDDVSLRAALFFQF